MAGGLFALLDDVAALARIAAASVDDVGAAAGRASAKAAGVVVDDTAVTPQYLHGSAAARELPIIKKIAIGSLRNKLLFILPAAVLLGQFLPRLLPVILIFGGAFLAYEGAHKVWERVTRPRAGGRGGGLPSRASSPPSTRSAPVANAIRTDFILSAEIMVIALKEVVGSDPDASIWMRAIVLAVVAVLITVLVYGVVALIVKMDDVGLHLAEKPSKGVAAGRPRPRRRHAPAAHGHLAHRHRWPCCGSAATSSWSASTRSAATTGCSRAPRLGDVLHAPYDLRPPLGGRRSTTPSAGPSARIAGWLLNTLVSALVGLRAWAASSWPSSTPSGSVAGHGSGHGDGPRGDEHGVEDREEPPRRTLRSHDEGHATDPGDPPAEDSPNR